MDAWLSLVPRPSPAPVFDCSIFAYCKQSKTRGGEGLGTRLACQSPTIEYCWTLTLTEQMHGYFLTLPIVYYDILWYPMISYGILWYTMVPHDILPMVSTYRVSWVLPSIFLPEHIVEGYRPEIYLPLIAIETGAGKQHQCSKVLQIMCGTQTWIIHSSGTVVPKELTWIIHSSGTVVPKRLTWIIHSGTVVPKGLTWIIHSGTVVPKGLT